MKKVVVISDSFKGTLSSQTIATIAKERINHFFPEAEVIAIPIADGGEGTVDAFLASRPGVAITKTVMGPDGLEVEATYALFGETAVIEMASAAGLTLMTNPNPLTATTYGVGELIRDAIRREAKEIILGLGGSATNDAGCGCVTALGGLFINEKNEPFLPTGDCLSQIVRIDLTRLITKDVTFRVMCDIDNPMHGPNGAAYVFSPQKGATVEQVQLLDQELKTLDQLIQRDLKRTVADIPGAGAAGGMGAGMVAFLGATLMPGIEVILDQVKFDEIIIDADFILTGEGRLDSQSQAGKVVSGVAKRAKGIPVIALVGQLGEGYDGIYQQGVTSIFITNRGGYTFDEIRQRDQAKDYIAALDDILNLMKKK